MRQRRHEAGLRDPQDAPGVADAAELALGLGIPAGAFCRGVSGRFRRYSVGHFVAAPQALLMAPQILTDFA